MNEAFLSFIWKFRLYHSGIKTTSGESISVTAPGEQHADSGPDFFNARVRIGETLWAGNVEIHTRSSDWYRHSHHSDGAYCGVILHVVYEADCDIMLKDQRTVPTVALKDFIDASTFEQYQNMVLSKQVIPCANSIDDVPGIIRDSWLDRMLVQRLEQRSEFVQEALTYGNGDYEQAFYHVLAGGFGFHINTLPFSMLARALPLRVLLKHADDPLLCEALVFGQAGFLEDDWNEWPEDYYRRELQTHYRFLASKYNLFPLDRHLWKFLRMRPVNFPTIRLSQFTRLVTSRPYLFSSFTNAGAASDCIKMLNVMAAEYWNTHYIFGKPAPYRVKRLGADSAAVLVINSVAPFLFMYGKWKGEESHCRKAIELLYALPAEKNSIISAWGKAGLELQTAYHTQAALELYKSYCLKKNCLNCSIGTAILKHRQ